VQAVPRLCGFYPGIFITTEGKHGNPSVKVAIHKHKIKIHNHNNKTLAQDGGRWRELVEKAKTL